MKCSCTPPTEETKRSSILLTRYHPNACCCGTDKPVPTSDGPPQGWYIRYFTCLTGATAAWLVAYSGMETAARWLVFDLLGLTQNSVAGAALEFFFYDTAKILLLLIALIYAIAWGRASLPVGRIRGWLAGRRRGVGHVLAAVLGAVTPFCSCSSVPMFWGFTSAGIPVGIAMTFLITSPLINEIAIIMLWGLLGWKFAVIYVVVGLGTGIAGGLVMDSIGAERWLRADLHTNIQIPSPAQQGDKAEAVRLSAYQRHIFALAEVKSIFRRVWLWVIAGVAIGAALHGFVPENWFAEHFSAGKWWTVPAAVLAGIPLYSNVTGIVPVMESLLVKGLPLGTTLAFCMGTVVASIPEVIMLRQIMTIRLQAAFLGYLWLALVLVGWLFNAAQPWLV